MPSQNNIIHRRRKASRPGEIIEAGLLEFSENGYAATRLEDVAKRAGVVKGTIYRYFEDKEALFFAAVRSRATPTFTGLEELVEAYEGTTRDLLTRLITMIHGKMVHGDMRILLQIIISEGKYFPQLAALYHREGISKGQAILRKIIKRGIERGEVREGAAANLPMVIMAPVLMAAIWQMLFVDLQQIDSEDFIAAHIDLVMDGILVN